MKYARLYYSRPKSEKKENVNVSFDLERKSVIKKSN